mmetsp:Transcript_15811/g.43228  ORF Transcript_15811/g.43228 Transcript_15811/m.43228 type:complete len:213 (+) Transcript_15811:856-1494(+)
MVAMARARAPSICAAVSKARVNGLTTTRSSVARMPACSRNAPVARACATPNSFSDASRFRTLTAPPASLCKPIPCRTAKSRTAGKGGGSERIAEISRTPHPAVRPEVKVASSGERNTSLTDEMAEASAVPRVSTDIVVVVVGGSASSSSACHLYVSAPRLARAVSSSSVRLVGAKAEGCERVTPDESIDKPLGASTSRRQWSSGVSAGPRVP